MKTKSVEPLEISVAQNGVLIRVAERGRGVTPTNNLLVFNDKMDLLKFIGNYFCDESQPPE